MSSCVLVLLKLVSLKNHAAASRNDQWVFRVLTCRNRQELQVGFEPLVMRCLVERTDPTRGDDQIRLNQLTAAETTHLQPTRDLHLALGAESLQLDDDLRAQSLPMPSFGEAQNVAQADGAPATDKRAETGRHVSIPTKGGKGRRSGLHESCE